MEGFTTVFLKLQMAKASVFSEKDRKKPLKYRNFKGF